MYMYMHMYTYSTHVFVHYTQYSVHGRIDTGLLPVYCVRVSVVCYCEIGEIHMYTYTTFIMEEKCKGEKNSGSLHVSSE